MRIAVWEYCTAAGLGRAESDPAHALWVLGRSMRDALAADFAALPGVTAWGCAESAQPFERQLAALRGEADWVVPIAPELGGLLGRGLAALAGGPARLLACGPEAVALTSDKLALARHWRARGVPTPGTWALVERPPERGVSAPRASVSQSAGAGEKDSGGLHPPLRVFPLVLKPRDGAGSLATFRLDAPADLAPAVAAAGAAGVPPERLIVQEYAAGTPMSAAFLVGPAGRLSLEPTRMCIGPDLAYLGGELPAPPAPADRARRLAARALDGVAGLLGFVGVDLILGDAADGSGDRAIEVNPRLCASYLGLRALAAANLAGEMRHLASGGVPRPVRWGAGPVAWGPGGIGA